MITDNKTDILYLSRLLTTREEYQSFWQRLEKILVHEKMPFSFIDNTCDIWCRDYMPIQITRTDFIQFKYQPSYCMDEKSRHTITDTSEVSIDQTIRSFESPLVIDGGNIVKSANRAVMTDKVFSDNKDYSKDFIIAEIQRLLNIDSLYIIPRAPYDYTGHADGMVRFIDDKTILVADYSGYSSGFKRKYTSALKSTGLTIMPYPGIFSKRHNKDGDLTAQGCYINFAQIGNIILLPQFDIPEDPLALKETQSIFPQCNVIPVLSNEIAENGGVLNCITWSIQT